VLTVSNEQRQILEQDGAPMPLVDGIAGKCYMVLPVEFSSAGSGVVRARIPGVRAVADADDPTDAAMTLAIVLGKLLNEVPEGLES